MRDHRQRDMAVPAMPAAHFIVIQPGFPPWPPQSIPRPSSACRRLAPSFADRCPAGYSTRNRPACHRTGCGAAAPSARPASTTTAVGCAPSRTTLAPWCRHRPIRSANRFQQRYGPSSRVACRNCSLQTGALLRTASTKCKPFCSIQTRRLRLSP